MYPTLAILTAAFASKGVPVTANSNDAGQTGDQFDYRTELKPAGIIAIDGRRVEDDSHFSLRFENSGRVVGEIAGAPIRFWASATSHRRLRERLTVEAKLAA